MSAARYSSRSDARRGPRRGAPGSVHQAGWQTPKVWQERAARLRRAGNGVQLRQPAPRRPMTFSRHNNPEGFR